MTDDKSYGHVTEFVQNATASAVSKKHKGAKPTRRDFKGRAFPKASIRALAKKAGIVRMAYGSMDKDGTSMDPEKDTYGWIDRKTFNVMENVLYDAIAIAHVGKKSMGSIDATKKSGKTVKRIIKERHILQAIERYGGMGLGSSEARQTMF